MTGHETALATIGMPPSVSVRLNPFKKPDSELPILKDAIPVPWCQDAYILSQRPVFTLHPLFHAGAYYVQDSSAMYVGHVFERLCLEFRSPAVLDLCAAPGGKTTHASSILRKQFGDDFTLVSNEVMRQRASILSDNVAIWGDPNVAVTSADPKIFGRQEGCFDMIIADVPCSGEGMFRKDPKAVEEWSEQLVEICAARQRRIIADVWPSLREGGIMVYSTCTFEEAENDANLKWIADELGGEIIPLGEAPAGVRETEYGHMLVPGEVPGEGQWVGALRKTAASRARTIDIQSLRPLRYGCSRGVMKGGVLIPDPDWALSIKFDRTSYPCTAVDKQTALHFLHRDTIMLPDAPLGYNVLTYRGLPIGFVKNLGSRCNNLHPQGRRIRMDIV